MDSGNEFWGHEPPRGTSSFVPNNVIDMTAIGNDVAPNHLVPNNMLVKLVWNRSAIGTVIAVGIMVPTQHVSNERLWLN